MSRCPQLCGVRKFTERKDTGCCAGMYIACDARLYHAVHSSARSLCGLTAAYSSARFLCGLTAAYNSARSLCCLAAAYSSARFLCCLTAAPVQRRQRMQGFLRLTGNDRLRARYPAGTSRRRPGYSCRRAGAALRFSACTAGIRTFLH